MDNGELPRTREVLCEHLHAKVRSLQPSLADKITGVLVEGRSNEEVIGLLVSDPLLEEAVDKVLLSLEECQREAKEGLGPQLFAAVADIDQELCAQVTGMLLELPLSSLASLLTNRDELQRAARKARTEYLRFIQEKESSKLEWTDSCLSEKKESIGELLYEKLLVDHPRDAAKLTGMLLQMDDQALVQVMENSEMLAKMVNMSLEALRNCDKEESK